MEPVAFRDQFGISPEVSGEGMTLNAMRFAVADIGKAEAVLRQTELRPNAMSGGWWCRRSGLWRNPDIRGRELELIPRLDRHGPRDNRNGNL